MIPTVHGDFETRSELDLREVGLHNYARHPSTDVWCLAYAFDDDEPELWLPWMPPPERLVAHTAGGGRFVAHNAPFELAIWSEILAKRYGFPALRPEQTYCTMAMGYAMGLPGALEDVALALGVNMQKDMEGRALMLRYARPWRVATPAKPDVVTQWLDECPSFTQGGVKMTGAEGLARIYDYCKQDVRVERAVEKRMMPLSERERRVWLMDYAINQRGVQVDIETAREGVKLAELIKVKADEAMTALTAGEVQTCGSLLALKGWIAKRGFTKPDGTPIDMDKQAITDLLSDESWGTPEVRKALMLRQEASQTSTSKLHTLVNQAGADGRVRNMFQYHGAAPGRWTGRGPQPHNFPRNPPEDMELILEKFRRGEWQYVDMFYGPPLSVLSKCLRGFLTPSPGNVLVHSDFSNVEGRGTAWVFGEQWKLKAFAAADAGTGPGIYELSASKILHKSVEEINKFERQAYGKVPELALGFAGGVGAFMKMAKTYGVKMPEAQADEIKKGWRSAHPMIVRGWYALNKAAIAAVQNPGVVVQAVQTDYLGNPMRDVPVKYRVAGSFLWCLLPSGRAICYPYPKLMDGIYGPQLTYMTVPGPDDVRIADPANGGAWARIATHGGPLTQNVVSGMCRDLLVDVMLQLHDEGYPIVLHVHDDCNLDVSFEIADAARARMDQLMNNPPAWAAGFPLAAKAEIMRRYG